MYPEAEGADAPAIPPGRPAAHSLLVLLGVSAPSFMLQLDANIVAVSLPSISQSLGASFAGSEWVITAYTLTFASLMLPAGAFADRFGRKRVLVAGLGLFTLASFFCGAAPNLAVLVAARALQGAGAAMQLSAGLATLSHAFSGAARARAFAFWGAAVGAGISLGPVAGGIITQGLGWQWAFYINLPIGVAAIATNLAVIADSKDPEQSGFDLAGAASFGALLLLTTLALIGGNRDGWRSPHILAELGGAAVLLPLFVVAELRQTRPMLDFAFFRKPTYLGANIAQFAFAAGLLTMLTYLPVYFQSALGYAPRAAGLMMLPMAVPLFVVPRLVAAQLAHRLSGRALLTLGLLLIAAGLAWMARQAAGLDHRVILAGMLLSGVGAGLLNGETTKVAMTVIPPERAGMASGISGTVRFTGVVVGFAALGVVLFGRMAAVIGAALPAAGEAGRAAFVRDVAAGRLSGAGHALAPAAALQRLALDAFGQGYQALLLAGAGLAAAAAVMTWCLVRAAETPPVARPHHSPAAPYPRK